MSLWQEARNAEGRPYYYNTQTKVTQWTKPLELMTPGERAYNAALEKSKWTEHTAQDGRKYWYHDDTKQSVWDMPSELKEILENGPTPPTGPANSGIVAGPLAIYQPYQHDPTQDENRESKPTVYATDSREYDSQYTQQDAEAAFMKLLKKAGVSHDWTWEKAMRAIIKEPQYRAIKDPKDRRAAFEKYTSELRVQEIEKAKDRIAKLRTDFTTMLKSHPEIKYYTRWKTALQIVQGETIFRSASDDSERRQLFEEYIADLRKAEQERENAVRREAITELAKHLKSMNLEPYTRWSEAQQLLDQDEYFNKEEKFRALSKLDILNAFESHIKVLERNFNDEKQRVKSLKQRKERKNREAFWSLLQDLRKKGLIGPRTKWMDIHPLIKDDEKYTNMVGQPGSTPLDFFWDMMEEIDRDMRHKKNIVLDVIDEKRYEIKETTTLEEFAAVLQTDSRTAEYDSETVGSIFDKLREKFVKRADEDRHQAERKQKRQIDAMRSYLKRLEPPIELTDTYELVRPRIEASEEFVALETEDLRKLAFEKFIRRLKEKQEDRKEKRDRDGDRHRDRSERDRSERDRGSERDRERERERERDKGRNGYYHKSSSRRTPEVDPYENDRKRAAEQRDRQYRAGSISRRDRDDHRDRDRERDRVRERSRDRMDRDRGSSRHSSHRERDRHERGGSREASHYERERREREEERERQYIRSRALEDDRRSKRRTRGMSIDSDSERQKDIKRSRHEPPAYEPTTVDRPITYSPPPFQGTALPIVKPPPVKIQPIAPVKVVAAAAEPVAKNAADKPKKSDATDEKGSESEEGEIAE